MKMISKKSLQPMDLYYRFGIWTKTLPWYWDSNRECLVLVKYEVKNGNKMSINWLRVRLYSQVVVRVFILLLAALRISLSQDLEPSEVILGGFIISASLLALPVHVQYFINSAAILQHVNELFHIKRIAGMENVSIVKKNMSYRV